MIFGGNGDDLGLGGLGSDQASWRSRRGSTQGRPGQRLHLGQEGFRHPEGQGRQRSPQRQGRCARRRDQLRPGPQWSRGRHARQEAGPEAEELLSQAASAEQHPERVLARRDPRRDPPVLAALGPAQVAAEAVGDRAPGRGEWARRRRGRAPTARRSPPPPAAAPSARARPGARSRAGRRSRRPGRGSAGSRSRACRRASGSRGPREEEPISSIPCSRQSWATCASITSTPRRLRGGGSSRLLRNMRVRRLAHGARPYLGHGGVHSHAPGARPDRPHRGRRRGQRAPDLRADRARPRRRRPARRAARAVPLRLSARGPAPPPRLPGGGPRGAWSSLAGEIEGIVALVGYPGADRAARRPTSPTRSSTPSPLRPTTRSRCSRDGEVLGTYRKIHLPNYGVFDERRYFEPGAGPAVLELDGAPVGLSVCEDLWIPGTPESEEAAAGARLIVNASASPYARRKGDARERMLTERARSTGVDRRPLQHRRGPGRADLRRPQRRRLAERRDAGAGGGVRARAARLRPAAAGRRARCRGRRRRADRSRRDRSPRRGRGGAAARGAARARGARGLRGAGLSACTTTSTSAASSPVVLGLFGGIDSALTAARVAVKALGADQVCRRRHALAVQLEQTTPESTARAIFAKNLGIPFHGVVPIASGAPGRRGHRRAGSAACSRTSRRKTSRPASAARSFMAFSNKFNHLLYYDGQQEREVAVGYCPTSTATCAVAWPSSATCPTISWQLSSGSSTSARAAS